MKTASPAPHPPQSDAVRNGEQSDTRPSIEGSWQAFKVICAEFLRAAGTASSELLEAAAKCVGLAYLGIQWDDDSPLHDVHRAAGAPALMRIVTRKVLEREAKIASSVEAVESSRCAP